jgi:hypothetical protein
MTDTASGITRGATVVIVLHTPREKFWGLVDEINSAGVFCRGLDLNAFDDWLSALVHSEPFLGVGDVFFPMWRIERIARDETAGEVPSLGDQVQKRTGRTVEDVMFPLPVGEG